MDQPTILWDFALTTLYNETFAQRGEELQRPIDIEALADKFGLTIEELDFTQNGATYEDFRIEIPLDKAVPFLTALADAKLFLNDNYGDWVEVRGADVDDEVIVPVRALAEKIRLGIGNEGDM